MARIRSIAPGIQSIRAHDSEVDCFFNTVTDATGETLLHLSTFGSDHRRSAPKSSQSIQLDVAMASQLIEVLYETFPSLAAAQPTTAHSPASSTRTNGRHRRAD
ncbi:hypothetical protein [Tomitella biformata]|uniref:hypothetical protein n=1 Tax=Tomitella biformata TaxID=630403 RepID=UPI000463CB99|nr:hypothetical protein [Tomitella biformata]